MREDRIIGKVTCLCYGYRKFMTPVTVNNIKYFSSELLGGSAWEFRNIVKYNNELCIAILMKNPLFRIRLCHLDDIPVLMTPIFQTSNSQGPSERSSLNAPLFIFMLLVPSCVFTLLHGESSSTSLMDSCF